MENIAFTKHLISVSKKMKADFGKGLNFFKTPCLSVHAVLQGTGGGFVVRYKY